LYAKGCPRIPDGGVKLPSSSSIINKLRVMTAEAKTKEVDVIEETFNVVCDDAISNMKHDEKTVFDSVCK
jgi:hypothetical protein